MKVLARNQPCGCIICSCEDEVQCHGCGAKNCGTKECVFKYCLDNKTYVEGGIMTNEEMSNVQKTNTDLAPCPFCGVNPPFAQLDSSSYSEHDEYMVICDNCDAYICGKKSEEEAIKAWNTRV